MHKTPQKKAVSEGRNASREAGRKRSRDYNCIYNRPGRVRGRVRTAILRRKMLLWMTE